MKKKVCRIIWLMIFTSALVIIIYGFTTRYYLVVSLGLMALIASIVPGIMLFGDDLPSPDDPEQPDPSNMRRWG